MDTQIHRFPDGEHATKSSLKRAWSLEQGTGQIHSAVTIKFPRKESDHYKGGASTKKKCYAIKSRSRTRSQRKLRKVTPGSLTKKKLPEFPSIVLILTDVVISVTKTWQHPALTKRQNTPFTTQFRMDERLDFQTGLQMPEGILYMNNTYKAHSNQWELSGTSTFQKSSTCLDLRHPSSEGWTAVQAFVQCFTQQKGRALQNSQEFRSRWRFLPSLVAIIV